MNRRNSANAGSARARVRNRRRPQPPTFAHRRGASRTGRSRRTVDSLHGRRFPPAAWRTPPGVVWSRLQSASHDVCRRRSRPPGRQRTARARRDDWHLPNPAFGVHLVDDQPRCGQAFHRSGRTVRSASLRKQCGSAPDGSRRWLPRRQGPRRHPRRPPRRL
jgi:hypothetical protein